ncbi:MAG: hypothetical protein R2880_19130 [Deinococcales bacterium]
MRIINFAHGEFVAIGMYIAISLNRAWGLDPYVSLLLALPFGFLWHGGAAFFTQTPCQFASR